MIRVALEAIITITVLLIARAIISSIVRSLSNPTTFTGRPQDRASSAFKPENHAPVSGTLHRDPVCGTFVPETTPFRRDQGGSTYYYCSKSCRESHSLVSHT
jgi:YHS domain-containing protein